MPADAVGRHLSFWPGELAIEEWKATEDYHEKKNRGALTSYGNSHPFGKKLAIILRYAEQGPVIWADSDILFFNDFTAFIPRHKTGFACGGSADFTTAYHDAVIEITGNNLSERYNFNAGLLYVCGQNIYEDFNLKHIIESIHPSYDFLSEQTIFAHLASKSMGILWPLQLIKSFHTDAQEIQAMPVEDVIARHYTSNVRHLFWRDAFFRL
jgi:lipopolysaccharide biosynthesis glycosyltransferase